MGKRRNKRRLEAAVQAIQAKWGPQALHQGPPPNTIPVPSWLPTGLTRLDKILAIGQGSQRSGGLPLGYVSELIGQITSGKRTLALHILAQAQQHYPCAYVDLAQTFDPAYAAACRVDLAHLAIISPVDPIQALDLTSDLVDGGHFGLIVFDSTAELLASSLSPPAASAVLRRLRQRLAGQLSALLFLSTPFFGEPGSVHNYPAGFDLGHVAALRLVISRQRWLRRHGGVHGYEATVTVLRHRWGQENQQATIRILFNGVHVSSPLDP